MKVAYCDRCGKKIPAKTWPEIQAEQMVNANQYIEPSHKVQRMYRGLYANYTWQDCDLCADCLKSLDDWMKSGKKVGESDNGC